MAYFQTYEFVPTTLSLLLCFADRASQYIYLSN